jgi:hypothetical protein
VRVVLLRTYNKNNTLGNLFILDDYKLVNHLYTVELPWLNNEPRKSCIPEGKYKVRRREAHESGSFKYPHYEVMGVTNRSYILFHVANYVHQLAGCIAPGLLHVDINNDGIIDVGNSRAALDTMLKLLPNGFNLSITS